MVSSVQVCKMAIRYAQNMYKPIYAVEICLLHITHLAQYANKHFMRRSGFYVHLNQLNRANIVKPA